MKISRQKVGPELATEWLGYNTHNRNHRATVVAQYTEAMAEGDWGNDIDPIAFAGELGGKGKNAPVLLNGQHRLFALVSADVTLEFIVIEGLELSDQIEMDAGVKRQLADQLRLVKGLTYPVETAAVLRLVYAYEHDLLRSRSRTASYSALLRYFEDHPDLPESIRPAHKVVQAIGGRVSVWGAAHYIISCIDDPGVEEDLDEFYESMMTGENLPGGSPILSLRTQIMAMTANKRVSRRSVISQTTQLAVTFKAWNAWRDGVTLNTLSWRGGGKHPEAFPVPA